MRSIKSTSGVSMMACAILALAGGCGNTSLTATGEFATFGKARVEGQAVSSSGALLDSVSVNVAFPPARSAEFTTAPGFSDRDGRFRVEIARIKPATTAIDTVTVTVV